MDLPQARLLIDAMGIEQRTISEELSRDTRTVTRWLTGVTPLPFELEEWLLERWQIFITAVADVSEDFHEGCSAPVPVWASQESLLAEGVSVSLSESRAMSRALLILAALSGSEPELIMQDKEL